jgi:hypothetical protein
MRKTLCAAALLVALVSAALGGAVLAQPENRRGEEQTFLTFPEWFLVFSPAEYADFVRTHSPDEFVFWGHIKQFWQSYAAVAAESHARGNPANPGYHLMIVVIGTSTTIEYAIRSAYETLVGRLAALTAAAPTEEDHYAARAAQDYVDFIRFRPWYEFDFTSRLRGLWSQTSWFGANNLRKWERKYALTTEYGVKAIYGKLIQLATRSIYETPREITSVAVARWPICNSSVATVEVILTADSAALLAIPRYEGFRVPMVALAHCGAEFQEIAGNRTVILLSTVHAIGSAQLNDSKLILRQPILTVPGRERTVYEVPVSQLAADLRRLDAAAPEVEIEHIFDY